jgi:hypothetical protein
MSETERTRIRERPPLKENMYERSLRYYRENNERMERGAIVIHEGDREPELSRQGRLVFYMDPRTFPDLPCQQWVVFRHEVRTQSGIHRHQGGIVIYVISGRGYSVVEGERHDWEADDLLLLPMQPGGVEHQHFNLDPINPALWVAFLYEPLMEHVAHEITQVSSTPEFRE